MSLHVRCTGGRARAKQSTCASAVAMDVQCHPAPSHASTLCAGPAWWLMPYVAVACLACTAAGAFINGSPVLSWAANNTAKLQLRCGRAGSEEEDTLQESMKALRAMPLTPLPSPLVYPCRLVCSPPRNAPCPALPRHTPEGLQCWTLFSTNAYGQANKVRQGMSNESCGPCTATSARKAGAYEKRTCPAVVGMGAGDLRQQYNMLCSGRAGGAAVTCGCYPKPASPAALHPLTQPPFQ